MFAYPPHAAWARRGHNEDTARHKGLTVAIGVARMRPASMVVMVELPEGDSLVPVLHDGYAHLLRNGVGHRISIIPLDVHSPISCAREC